MGEENLKMANKSGKKERKVYQCACNPQYEDERLTDQLILLTRCWMRNGQPDCLDFFSRQSCTVVVCEKYTHVLRKNEVIKDKSCLYGN